MLGHNDVFPGQGSFPGTGQRVRGPSEWSARDELRGLETGMPRKCRRREADILAPGREGRSLSAECYSDGDKRVDLRSVDGARVPFTRVEMKAGSLASGPGEPSLPSLTTATPSCNAMSVSIAVDAVNVAIRTDF